jgi:hypothetical protein
VESVIDKHSLPVLNFGPEAELSLLIEYSLVRPNNCAQRLGSRLHIHADVPNSEKERASLVLCQTVTSQSMISEFESFNSCCAEIHCGCSAFSLLMDHFT